MPDTVTTSAPQADRRHGSGDPAAVIVKIARDLAQELHRGRKAVQQPGLDSALDTDWGFDSLSRAELLLRIERTFSTRLPDRLLSEAETLRDILSALGRSRSPTQAGPAVGVRRPTPEPAEPAPATAKTLLEVLDWHVRHHGDRVHIVLVENDDRESRITYRDLAEHAQVVARGLRGQALEPGERVAIMLPTGRAFFAAFFGVLQAGGVPTPIYPPARMSQLEEHLNRQAGILRNACAAMLITAPETRAVARLLKLQVESLRSIVAVDDLDTGDAALPPPPVEASTALLQYTSGSTGDPKGGVLSHANLLANIRAMGQAMEAGPSDVFASWLPLYHDMGLIGAWLGSLYFAAPLVVMSPLTFIMRPAQWLWAIHRHRATLSAAPNFAFELCLRKVSDSAIAGLDLSSLRMVANGAEPVNPETIRRFSDRFGKYGFRPQAMAPVYGLAENAVGLAFPPLGRESVVDRVDRTTLARHGRAVEAAAGQSDALEFVACGRPLPGHQVRIVDAVGEVGERRQGSLQFRGPSATSGYFDSPAATRELMDGDWLNSGDLAYIAGGDIFITGRSKDVVIRAGRNVYPAEVETAVGNLDGIRKGCVAVFGAEDPRLGTERLVIVAETRETAPARTSSLRQRVSETAARLLESPPEEIVLAPPGAVPKTSSGKLRRSAARALFEEGRLGARPRPASYQLARLAMAGMLTQVQQSARIAVGFAYAGWWWFVLAVFGAVLWPIIVLGPGGRRWRWAVLRGAGRGLLRLTAIRLSVTGTAPASEHEIVVANHSSYLDSLVLAAFLPGEPMFVAKKELDPQLVAGPFLRAIGTLFVDRADLAGSVEDTRKSIEAAQAGKRLVFFPEGTLTRIPGLRPFRLGAFVVAVQRQCRVLPIALQGTRSILRGGQWLPRRGKVSAHIGEPIAPDGQDFTAAIRLRDRARAALLPYTGEPDLAQG